MVGGGDTALEEALFLTRYASRVFLVHRRSEFRGTKLLQERIAAEPKIEPVLDAVVERDRGRRTAVTGLALKNVKTGAASRLAVEGAFIFVGTTPNTEFLRGFLPLDAQGLHRDDAEPRDDGPRGLRRRRRARQGAAPDLDGRRRGRARRHDGRPLPLALTARVGRTPRRPVRQLPFHYAWVIVVGGTLTTFAALGLGRFALGMLLPSMAADLGLGYARMGLIGTANFVGYLIAVLASGIVAARGRPAPDGRRGAAARRRLARRGQPRRLPRRAARRSTS